MDYRKDERYIPWKRLKLYTWQVGPSSSKLPTVVLLHGAGTSSSERFEGMSNALATAGYRVITMDFAGHGKSSGILSESSLAQRADQALRVINEWLGPSEPLIICGF